MGRLIIGNNVWWLRCGYHRSPVRNHLSASDRKKDGASAALDRANVVKKCEAGFC